MIYSEQLVGRNSVVGIATPYEQDGPEMESRGVGEGARFSTPVQNGPGAHPASNAMGTGLFPEVKGQSVVLNTHPYLSPPSEPLRSVLG